MGGSYNLYRDPKGIAKQMHFHLENHMLNVLKRALRSVEKENYFFREETFQFRRDILHLPKTCDKSAGKVAI